MWDFIVLAAKVKRNVQIGNEWRLLWAIGARGISDRTSAVYKKVIPGSARDDRLLGLSERKSDDERSVIWRWG
jgi:hypothetical protein